jgi:hypothetical protein
MPANPSNFLSISLAAVALTGCALFYTPTLTPGPDTAVLRAGTWGGVYRGGSVSIVSVSGATPSWTDTRQMVIPPGERRGEFQVLLCENEQLQCRPLTRVGVAFRADAGSAYVVRAQETVNGSDRFSVWVENAQSGAVAGRTDP